MKYIIISVLIILSLDSCKDCPDCEQTIYMTIISTGKTEKVGFGKGDLCGAKTETKIRQVYYRGEPAIETIVTECY